jgi:hypothetical protein
MFKKFLLLFALLPLFVTAQQLDLSQIKQLKIRNVGPANMSGRITAIAVAATDPKIMVVGAASGGVWKSTNGGSAWEPIFDDQPTQNIGAVAIDPNNADIIWVGTGEGNPRNSVNLGMGLFKSEDGGAYLEASRARENQVDSSHSHRPHRIKYRVHRGTWRSFHAQYRSGIIQNY